MSRDFCETGQQASVQRTAFAPAESPAVSSCVPGCFIRSYRPRPGGPPGRGGGSGGLLQPPHSPNLAFRARG